MINCDPARLKRLIKKLRGRRVLVLGDLMLDKYIWGGVTRISPEAPVPVVDVQRSTQALGGAGNGERNLASLGGSPVLVGLVGDDPEGAWIKRHAAETRGILVEDGRPTTVKTRIIAHHQQVVRVDQERRKPVPPEIEARITAFIRKDEPEGIIVSDYNKGIVTRSLMDKILPLAKRRGIPVFVDPKVENFALYSPITLLSPNHHEAARIVRHACLTDAEVEQAGREIMAMIETTFLIIKRGEQGMSLFERGVRKPIHIPTIAREVFDVTGAGDTVIAAAALALLAGASLLAAAGIANAAGGGGVGKIGTATCSPDELTAALDRYE